MGAVELGKRISRRTSDVSVNHSAGDGQVPRGRARSNELRNALPGQKPLHEDIVTLVDLFEGITLIQARTLSCSDSELDLAPRVLRPAFSAIAVRLRVDQLGTAP